MHVYRERERKGETNKETTKERTKEKDKEIKAATRFFALRISVVVPHLIVAAEVIQFFALQTRVGLHQLTTKELHLDTAKQCETSLDTAHSLGQPLQPKPREEPPASWAEAPGEWKKRREKEKK